MRIKRNHLAALATGTTMIVAVQLLFQTFNFDMTTPDGLLNAFVLMIGAELSVPVWGVFYYILAGELDSQQKTQGDTN